MNFDRAEAAVLITHAERWFNTRNLEAIMSMYTKDSELELLADGVSACYVGIDDIRRAWTLVFGIFPKFYLEKTLVSTEEVDETGIVVDEWAGKIDGHRLARGCEIFWLDRDGKVARQRVVSSSHVLEYGTLAGRMRFAMVHPRQALRAMRLESSIKAS